MTTKITNKNILITGLVLLVAFVYILPLFYGISVSLKTKEQLSSLNQSPLPMKPKTFEYNGKKLEVFLVPINEERTKEMAALQKGRDGCVFIDIDSVSNEKYNWSGQWRTLEKAWEISPKWSNFLTAWKAVNFPQLFKNTLMYAVVSTIGAVFSALFVAYGFARYDFPGKKILFIILIATIVLPSAVTLIPQYTMFYKLGWIGTWLPLIVPHFFGNAFNIFLLRQFIMGIPREMDEAACVPDNSSAGNPVCNFSRIVPLLLCLERLLQSAYLSCRKAGKAAYYCRTFKVQRNVFNRKQPYSGSEPFSVHCSICNFLYRAEILYQWSSNFRS